MVYLKGVFRHWKRVFGNFEYVVLGIVVAILFYALNVVIASWKSLFEFSSSFGFWGTIKFFLLLIIGFGDTILLHSFISLILISLLLGMLVSLIFYKTRIASGVGSKKVGFIGTVGIFLGALVPGCAACGVGLASLLGLSSVLITILPFEGLELSLLAVVILIYAIFKISNDSCKIMFNKNERRLK